MTESTAPGAGNEKPAAGNEKPAAGHKEPAAGSAPAPFSDGYRIYALSLLVVVYVFNFVDRQILGILVEPIKQDLGVSDTAMGLLGGIAFAIFYTALGVPIARLADRGSRRNILTVCLTIWSGMTALCGFAGNFYHLLLARIGVAVGEAGGSPPSHSMISDMFPPATRATALAIYALGIPIGTMIGNKIGGWANDEYGWRTAFLIVGTPGLLLALLVRFTLREPPRGYSENVKLQAGEAPPVKDVFRHLWQRRSFRYMSIGAALHAFVGYGVGYWIAPFFNRSHDFSTSQIGNALFWLGFASIAGTLSGGYFADKLGKRDARWYVWLPAGATLASVPFSAFVYLADAPYLALWVMSVPYVLGAYYLGPTFSLTQGLVGLRMRALAASILWFILNIIGLGLGPQFTGIISDVLNWTTDLGQESLRYSLVICLVFNVVSAAMYFAAARTLREDLAASQAMAQAQG